MAEEATDDRALVEAWRAGDQRAGFQLFERYYDAIARFFHSKVAEDGFDLVQKTFLGCVEGLPRFRGETSFRSYLFAIAYRQLCQHLRVRCRERQRLDFAEVSIADLRPSAAAELGHRQEVRLLRAAIRQIPVDAQVILELHYWEGVTTGEIAEILGIPPGTARTRLMRARQLLEVKMRESSQPVALVESTVTGLERWAAELRLGLDAQRGGKGRP